MPIDPNSPFGETLGIIIDDLQAYEDNRTSLYTQLNSVNDQISSLSNQKVQIEEQINLYDKNIKGKYDELNSVVQFRGPMKGNN